MRYDDRCPRCGENRNWHCGECRACHFQHKMDCSAGRTARRRDTHNAETCTVCGASSVATYQCEKCDHTFRAPGVLEWSRADAVHLHFVDDDALAEAMALHFKEHDGA